jgi:diguanylate cyclase (GGDEF)-like protein
MITDREAARMRAEKVINEISGRVHRALHSGRADGMTLHSTLPPAVTEMLEKVCAVYAEEVAGASASEPPLSDELKTEIATRVNAFISSTHAGLRPNAGGPARLAAELQGRVSMGVHGTFALAAHAANKARAGAAKPVATRRKQDKFEILDSPSHYAEDFRSSVGKLGVSVIFFDLDHFKQLNTRFSEPVIDRALLKDLNKLIAELADKRGFAYAEGGDEFIVMLPNTNAAQAEVFAVVLLDAIRAATFRVDGEPIRVTASAGIASAMDPEAGQVCREAAAKAKQKAKDDGRNRYVVAD